jgi:hypothetical protein
MASKKTQYMLELLFAVYHRFNALFGVLTLSDQIEDIAKIVLKQPTSPPDEYLILKNRAGYLQQIHYVRECVVLRALVSGISEL